MAKYADNEIRYNREFEPKNFYNGPLVVLTSKASASAAEIVSQALQDEGVAILVGDERTYGKGSMQYQTITDPNATRFFKVTIGRYYTVSGRSAQMDGVMADICVPTSFSHAPIGERFLLYPLANEPLNPTKNIKDDLHKIFDAYAKRQKTTWEKILPNLRINSSRRLENDKNFETFLHYLESGQTKPAGLKEFGVEDLQMSEATSIIKDMIYLSK